MQQQLLLIDDSKHIHPLIKALLTDEQLEIHSAYDAEMGLSLVKSLRPDLILMDVDMPGINGFEACRKLKSDPTNALIPLIFLTSCGSIEEKVRGLELGAVDYVTKPCNRAELQARVRASLRMSQLMRLLEEKALIDALTGLGNRAMFEQRMGAEIALRIRSGTPLACMLLDLDHFKTINDSFGHPFGDFVLRKVANVISEHCRTEDVGCRLGGEEFAVLAPNTTAEQAAMLAERMRAAVAKTAFVQNGKSIAVTCSFGVVDAGDPYDRSLMERADAALYESKQQGRNRVTASAAPTKAITTANLRPIPKMTVAVA
jgi:diguanylate cyclase (GGDEF)-like protein